MNIVALIVYSLATWRIASLLANEDGPFDILEHMRYRIGVRYDERSARYGKNELARAILCTWCASLWIAAVWVLLALALPVVALWIAAPFAVSAGALIVERIADG